MKQVLARGLRIVAWGLALAFVAASAPARADEAVPMASDLQRDGTEAQANENAVLVVFVGEHCPYCKQVLNEFLIPMSGNQEYQQKVVMRRVERYGSQTLQDFNGNPTTHGEFSQSHGIRFVPTVAIFDKRGRLLAKPLVGLSTIDYYGSYLDEMIDKGLSKIRRVGMGGGLSDATSAQGSQPIAR